MDTSNTDVTLIYRGQSSTDLGIFIKWPFTFVHAVPDYNKQHVNGRNGDFIQDQGSFQNVTETFDIFVKMPKEYNNLFEYETALTEWLKGNDYSYLGISNFPDYVFEAIYDSSMSITWNENDWRQGEGQLAFDCKPFFKRSDGINYIPLPENGVVYNYEKVPAIPDWHFKGSGDFTLYVNDKPYEFHGIDGDIWLNGDGNANSLENGDYTTLMNNSIRLTNNEAPVLEPQSQNKISIKLQDGASVSISEYKPNWSRLI